MEIAANRTAKEYSRYGSTVHKQVYIYGGLDRGPTEFNRAFGMAWGIGGWLLTPFLQKIGPKAIDDHGLEVGRWRGTNDASGWVELQDWATVLGRGLAQHLLARQELVSEVNLRWTAMVRVRARRSDKSDRLDARAVALFVRQEAPDLAGVGPEDETVALDLLTTEREAAVREATRLRNQLHALLQQLDPHYRQIVPSMKTRSGLERLKSFEAAADAGIAQQARAASVRRLLLRLELALAQVEELSKQRGALTAPASLHSPRSAA
jgi:Transposase